MKGINILFFMTSTISRGGNLYRGGLFWGWVECDLHNLMRVSLLEVV